MKANAFRLDGGTQPRAEIDEKVVADYAEAMREGAAFPPVVAYYDGSDYWLADGFHRVGAALREGMDVEAEVRQGTRRDAVLYSVGVNSAHGLRRTNEDKRRAVLTLLGDAEWCAWSDGVIAEKCAVSQPFVSSLRRASGQNGFDVKGQDGKTYTRPARAPDPVVNEMDLDEEESQYIDEDEGYAEEEPGSSSRMFDPPELDETRAFDALRSDISRIENRLILLSDPIAQHEYVNGLIKFLKSKAADFNRAAIA